VFEGMPVACVVKRDAGCCSYCFKEKNEFMRCSHCKFQLYCGRGCQVCYDYLFSFSVLNFVIHSFILAKGLEGRT